MYLVLLLGLLGVLSLASLVISGVCLARVWAMANSTHNVQMVSPFEGKDVDELMNEFGDIDKVNKRVKDDFDEEYTSVLESRGM